MTDLLLFAPEIVLALTGLGILVFGVEKSGPWAALAMLAGAGWMAFKPMDGTAFANMVVVDGLARYAKTLILVAAAFSLALAPSFLKDARAVKPEYAVLVLFAALGMMIMVSANDLLALYAGLELQNLALYVLAAFFRDDPRGGEAGIKYIVLGGVSSAILLFGFSFLYGASGATGYVAVAGGHGPLFTIGLAFAMVGFAFKIAVVPFHIWAPDVYEGAGAPVTGFFLAAPKVAGLVALARFLGGPLGGASDIWVPMLLFFALASMAVGAFGGLAQTNIKRLMAYSAITNMGVMLVGLVLPRAAAVDGLGGALLYLALYFAGTYALFAGILLLRRDGRAIENIRDFSGLMKTHPSLATGLGAALFSLAGIPPLAGFFGKYNVLLAAVKGGRIDLAVAGVLASVVAAAYYLRVIKVMAFDPQPEKPLDVIEDRTLHAAFVLAALAVSLFVIAPAPLMDAAQRAAQSLLSP